MLSCVLGFFVGAVVVICGGVILQAIIIRQVAPALGYRFDKYVFHGEKFPSGDFEQGRVVRRCLFPARVEIHFYDGQYNEVTEAAKPGRYGAVVRMKLNWGVEMLRFITLYRTPEKVFWSNGPMTVAVELPPNTGVDATVAANQGRQIGEMFKHGFAGDGEVSPQLAILLAGLAETSPNDPPAVERLSAVPRDAMWWYGLRQRLGLAQKYPYLVDLPRGYKDEPGQSWPLILYLHGGNENGHNLKVVRKSGLPAIIEWAEKDEARLNKRPQAIVISPQAPWYEDWNPQVLCDLIDEVCAKYRADPERVSVTGISSGAKATWTMGMTYPERLAAIIPVAADNDFADAARLKNLPTWAFTGLKDDIVPAENVMRMVEAIRNAGGKPHLTVYSSQGHGIEFESYLIDDLYTWIFAQRRGQPEVITAGVPESSSASN